LRITGIRGAFPLLKKELIEQANRKRTYWIRGIYALLLITLFLLIFHENYRWMSGPLGLLGKGKDIMIILVGLQFGGIYVFLPAMMCGVITSEKERDSMGLLMMTSLGPWEILMEKYFGRLVPMFSFLLLGLPLLAICYSYGGISPEALWNAIFYLFLTCFQVGALALMFSSFCRSMVAAFMATYISGGIIFFLIPLIFCSGFSVKEDIMLCHIPAFVYFEKILRGAGGTFNFQRAVPILISIGTFLLISRFFLIRRALLPARNPFLHFLKIVDGIMMKINKVFGGLILGKDRSSLPGDQPVAWLEVKKKSLGKLQYLIRIGLFLEVVTIITIISLAISERNPHDEISVAILCLWVLVTLILTVQSAGLFSSEKSHQTLDILLSTPLSGAEIIRQKMKGLNRMMIVLGIPLFTLYFYQWYFRDLNSHYGYNRNFNPTVYLVSSLLAVVVYFPMISWVSLWMGIRVKARFKSIFVSMGGIVAWITLPLFFLFIFMILVRLGKNDMFFYFIFFSPAAILPLTEFMAFSPRHNYNNNLHHFWLIFLNFSFYAYCFWLIRSLCLRGADRLLGRAREVSEFPIEIKETEPVSDVSSPRAFALINVIFWILFGILGISFLLKFGQGK